MSSFLSKITINLSVATPITLLSLWGGSTGKFGKNEPLHLKTKRSPLRDKAYENGFYGWDSEDGKLTVETYFGLFKVVKFDNNAITVHHQNGYINFEELNRTIRKIYLRPVDILEE